MEADDDLILIAGPTASGKSDLAMKLASERDSVIVNADSMQVYSGLRLITARPSPEDEEKVPHALFGHVFPGDDYSVARWLEEAKSVITATLNRGSRVVVVGGTGLYFSALTKGLSAIPEIDPEVREKWREIQKTRPETLHEELAKRDRQMAERLKPGDQQRICRALEVIEMTGRSLADWQVEQSILPLLGVERSKRILLLPERSLLHERINIRFDKMLTQGAIEEVKDFLKLGVAPGKPAMKAIGVRQLADYFEGKLTLSEASEKAKAASRQYAKRQYTWFRNQFGPEWARFPPQN